MIPALFALLLQLLAHLTGPAAASPAHGGTVPPPPAVVAPGAVPKTTPSPAPAPLRPEGRQPVPPAAETVPGCAAGEEWDGLRCVALQLPEETIGRADW